MGITEATSQKLRNMGFLCVALVVMIHMGLREELTSPTWLVAQLLKDGICRIAVPFFFLVSGFFLAAHCAETGWWGREVRKRVLSLVVPFYLWLLTFVGVVAVSSLLAWAVHCPLGTSVDQLRSMGWIQCLGLDLTDAPFLIPLWYVRCLFIFVLLSPLICKVVGKLGWGWLVVCFGAELGLDRLTPLVGNHFFEYGFSLSGLF